MTTRLSLGGEFDLTASQLGQTCLEATALPGLGFAHETWVDFGRSALSLIARAHLTAGRSPRIWMPAYCCESMVAPFKQHNFDVRYYRVGGQLDSVDAEPARGDALLFAHYFGTRNRGAVARAPHWRDSGVNVIEDCVQAALNSDVGRHGDHAVTSLRKLLPVVDGALLASRAPLSTQLPPADEAFVSARVAGRLLRTAQAPEADYLELFGWTEARIENSPPRQMSWMSRRLLAGVDLVEAARRRLANWSFLHERLRACPDLSGLVPFAHEWQPGEIPLGYVLRIPRGQRDPLRAALAAENIYCPIHWPLPHVPTQSFPEEHALSRSLLTLPIDQRHSQAQLDRMVTALQSFSGDLR